MERFSKHVETQKSFNVELKTQIKKLESKLIKADTRKSGDGVVGGGGNDKELVKQNAALQARVKELEVKADRAEKSGGGGGAGKGGESVKEGKIKTQIDEMKKNLAEKEMKIKELTKELKSAAFEGNAAAAADKQELKKKDKILKVCHVITTICWEMVSRVLGIHGKWKVISFAFLTSNHYPHFLRNWRKKWRQRRRGWKRAKRIPPS